MMCLTSSETAKMFFLVVVLFYITLLIEKALVTEMSESSTCSSVTTGIDSHFNFSHLIGYVETAHRGNFMFLK